MNLLLSRRNFLRKTTGALTLGTSAALLTPHATAVEPLRRPGSARMRLSLAAYSFRDYLKSNRGEPTSQNKRIILEDFIDFCADHGCAGTELTSYYFPTPVTREYLLSLRRHAFLRGIEVSGTAVGNTFTLPEGAKRDAEIKQVKGWIDHAQTLGAPHIRVFAGSAEGANKEEAKKRCIQAFQECAEYAGEKGIFLGLENHGGIVAEADDLLDIIRAIQSPWVGLNLDTGNFHTADPYADIARCAPWAVNVQIKAELQRRGAKTEEADLPRLTSILRDANYQGYVALEYESAASPWERVPLLLDQLRKLL